MNEAGPNNVCSRCGALVAPEALRGLCPRCLLALNIGTQTELPGDKVESPGTIAAKPPPPSPEAIAQLFPQFEILECLGRGGMGAVYKARQPQLDRLVALKILLPERQGDPQFAQRFAREARALARLNHSAIVAVYDFGEAGGYPYLVMEYVDGLSLRQLLQRGKLAPEEALAIVPKLCEALQFAHQQGIVHRDIKPENILLDKLGQVKIADFSIAKILSPGAPDLSLTGGHDVVGTPHYMAPEQVERPAKVDHRADIFSLGVVFYEMLTGELPLGRFAPPSQRVHVDVRLDQVVLHALEKDPTRRYQQASQVKTDVEAITTGSQREQKAVGSPVEAWLSSLFPDTWNGLEIVRWSARLLGLVLLMFSVVTFGLFVFGAGLPPLAQQSGGTMLNGLAMALMVLGFILGWKLEGTAAVLIASGWALWHSSIGTLAWSMFHLASLVAGLYAYCWWAIRGRRTLVVAMTAGSLAVLLTCGLRFLPSNVYLYGTVRDAATGQAIPNAEIAVSHRPLFASNPWLSWLPKLWWKLMVTTDPYSPKDPRFMDRTRSLADGYYALRVGWHTPGKQMQITASGYAVSEVALDSKPGWSRRVRRDLALPPAPKAASLVTVPDMSPTPEATPIAGQSQSPATLLLNFFQWGQASSEQVAREYSPDWLPRLFDPDALIRLGCALYDARRYADALEVFRRMEQMGRRGVALVWQGHMLDLLDRRSEALAAYREALSASVGRTDHAQYGIVLTTNYVEQRLQTPFARIENRAARPITRSDYVVQPPPAGSGSDTNATPR